ncbi:MAG: GerMN domain-containing protein [Clostridia bacterium]|nr:GerMN domain-containing protein [Clostridia bacterium]
MKKLLSILITVCLVTAVLSGCSLFQKIGGGEDDEAAPVSSIAMGEEDASKISDKVPIHLYFANDDNTKLKLEVRYVPLSEAKKSVNNLASIVVNELIKGPSGNTGFKPTIPEGTKLRSPINIKAGIATVDFSKDFLEKHPGGKNMEQLTIYSVANSLTELKEIHKVKFLINGKTQKEYKGNFQFDTPFPRSASLISKEVTTASEVEKESKEKESKEKDSKEKDSKEKDQEKSAEDKSKEPSDSKDGAGKATAKPTSLSDLEDEEAASTEGLDIDTEETLEILE